MKKKLIGILLATTLVAIVFAGCTGDGDKEDLVHYKINIVNETEDIYDVQCNLWNTTTNVDWNRSFEVAPFSEETVAEFEIPKGRYVTWTIITKRGFHSGSESGGPLFFTQDSVVYKVEITNTSIKAGVY